MARNSAARVLVTGGAGFIGSHLVERLVARGDRVCVVDDSRNGRRENLAAVAPHITIIDGDCHAAAAVVASDHPDLVFHLAAPAYVPPSVDDPIGDLRANVEQTLVLLQALRASSHPTKLLHVSSAAVYGQPETQPIPEECPPAPVSPYGVDKFAAEEHVRVAARLHGIPAAILRYFPVYGPRQRKQVVFDLINKVITDPSCIEVFGTGRELRDMIFVDDVVTATLLTAARAPARGEAYNVGTGTMAAIADVVAAVVRALGAHPEVHYTGAVRKGDSERMVADITKLRALGFSPTVALAEGVARTAAWVTGQHERASDGAVA